MSNDAYLRPKSQSTAVYHTDTSHGRVIRLFKSYCYTIYRCPLWRHSYQNSIRKLTLSYSDTFKRLINASRYTGSSLAFAMNTNDQDTVRSLRIPARPAHYYKVLCRYQEEDAAGRVSLHIPKQKPQESMKNKTETS